MATQADYDAITAQITAGIKSVTYADGRQVQYASVAGWSASATASPQNLVLPAPAPRGAFIAIRTSGRGCDVLDQLIAWLSPDAALRRARAQAALAALGHRAYGAPAAPIGWRTGARTVIGRRRSGAGAGDVAQSGARPAPQQPVGCARRGADRREPRRVRHRRQHRRRRQAGAKSAPSG